MGIAIAGGGDVEPEGPFRLEVASITGLRLSEQALETAQRKAEAAWGAPVGPDLENGVRLLRQSVATGVVKEREKVEKVKWLGLLLPRFLGSKGHEDHVTDEDDDDPDDDDATGQVLIYDPKYPNK
jgi:hypothetical protein